MPARGVSCSTGGGADTASPTDCGTLKVLLAGDPAPGDEPAAADAAADELPGPPADDPVPVPPAGVVPLRSFGLTGVFDGQAGGQTAGRPAFPGRLGAEVEGAGGLGLGSTGSNDGKLRLAEPKPRLRLTPSPAAEAGGAAELTAKAAASAARAEAASSRRAEPVIPCGRGRRMAR